MKLTNVAVGCLLASGLMPLPGKADIMIYDGGSPDQRAAYTADSNYAFTTVAETFVLSVGSSTVTGAQWWGACANKSSPGGGACPAGNFTIGFYTDNSGVPGTLVKSYTVGNADQTATGNFIANETSLSEYVYTANFGPLSLTPGTTYFLTVEDSTPGSALSWGMETANETGSLEVFLTGDGWLNEGAELAFNLSGPSTAAVPEPTSLLLLGSVGLSLVAAFRRKVGAAPRR